MRKILIALLFACSLHVSAQNFTSSNLPIFLITTDGSVDIPGDPRANGNLKIIYRGEGERNNVSDQNTEEFLDYDGRIEIETRGSSSEDLPKKQYAFSTLEDDDSDTDNVSLLDMSKENDWILNGLAYDESLMRDYISYNLSRQIGQYATRTRYCEVVINGDYRGLYVLQEKVKQDDNRVDINEISEADISSPYVSGGYITKTDKNDGPHEVAWSMPVNSGNDAEFVHVVPKPQDAKVQQTSYIRGEFNKLASTSASNNMSLTNGYPSIIDVPSFVDFMLINELSSNVDAYTFSTFFHKDRNGKLRAGPIWDLNLTYGNDLFMYGLDRSHYDVWQFDNWDNVGPKFWKDLFDAPDFKCHLSRRWNELTQTGQPLNQSSLGTFINETAALIAEAAGREQARWGSVVDHADNIEDMKRWIGERIVWMNDNIGSYAACSNPQLSELVITKIHYRPLEPSSGSQEFIEIQNIGTSVADLTGVYIGGTGLVYQFPANSALGGGESIVLASNTATYAFKYGEEAFGEFSRNLSNDGQTISLLDGFGNVIDEVTYNDKLPWPEEADGQGYYLELTDPTSDNNDPLNWVATQDVEFTLSLGDEVEKGISLYPNPVTDMLHVESTELIKAISIFDIQGRKLSSIDVNQSKYELDVSGLEAGVYVLEVMTDEGKSINSMIRK